MTKNTHNDSILSPASRKTTWPSHRRLEILARALLNCLLFQLRFNRVPRCLVPVQVHSIQQQLQTRAQDKHRQQQQAAIEIRCTFRNLGFQCVGSHPMHSYSSYYPLYWDSCYQFTIFKVRHA